MRVELGESAGFAGIGGVAELVGGEDVAAGKADERVDPAASRHGLERSFRFVKNCPMPSQTSAPPERPRQVVRMIPTSL